MISPESTSGAEWKNKTQWSRCFFYTSHDSEEAAKGDLEWARTNALMDARIRHDICGPWQGRDRRPGFEKLYNELKQYDRLVCSSLKDLGPNALRIHQEIERLMARGVMLFFLSLGLRRWGTKPTMMVAQCLLEISELSTVAHRHQVRKGLDAALADGKRLGRKRALTPEETSAALLMWQRKEGTLVEIAQHYGVSPRTLTRHRAK